MSEIVKELRYNHEKSVEHFAKRLAFTLGPVELKEMMEKSTIRILDVRAREDYEISHLPSAINIPYAELKDNMDKLSKDELTIVYCYNYLCHLGDRAALKIAEAEYPVMLLEGGFKSWTEDFRFATSS